MVHAQLHDVGPSVQHRPRVPQVGHCQQPAALRAPTEVFPMQAPLKIREMDIIRLHSRQSLCVFISCQNKYIWYVRGLQTQKIGEARNIQTIICPSIMACVLQFPLCSIHHDRGLPRNICSIPQFPSMFHLSEKRTASKHGHQYRARRPHLHDDGDGGAGGVAGAGEGGLHLVQRAHQGLLQLFPPLHIGLPAVLRRRLPRRQQRLQHLRACAHM